jgi:hypothetical protein
MRRKCRAYPILILLSNRCWGVKHIILLRRPTSPPQQRSGQVIAGMALLLALCGWIVGGDDGALAALQSAMPQVSEGETVSPDMVRRQFGAGLLHPADMPVLFEILSDVCRRARLSRMPDLYYLPFPGNMNAMRLAHRTDRSSSLRGNRAG